jgi:UPF0271 protein
LIRAGREAGLAVASEVFADRTYQADGSLTPRTRSDAMIEDVERSIAQVLGMVGRGTVQATDGTQVKVEADTLCIHGDQPAARGFAARLREALQAAGVEVRAPRS